MNLSSADVASAIPGFSQPVSSLSHLLAAVAAAMAAAPLIRLAGASWSRRLAIVVYAGSVIAMLTISGTYHALDLGSAERAIMKRMDYVAIWLLIAGTLTAVQGILCRGRRRSIMLAFTWSYAGAGVLLQVFCFDLFSGLPGLLLYLGLGWLGGLSIYKPAQIIGARAVRTFWAAGVVYSVGAILEGFNLPTLVHRWVGPHEIFHLTVVLGAALHWSFIRRMLLFKQAPAGAAP